MMRLQVTATYPVLRLIEQGKLSRRKFEDRARRAAARLERIETDTKRELRDTLRDMDDEIRSAIASKGTARELTGRDVDRAIDEAVDRAVARRRATMLQANQRAINAAQQFRDDVAKVGDQNATPAPIDRKQAEKISDVQDRANQAFGEDLRSRIKREVADGIADGRTPKQIAEDLKTKRITSPQAVAQSKAEKRERMAKGLPPRKTQGVGARMETQTETELAQIFNAAAGSGATAEGKPGNLKTWVNRPPRIRPTHLEAARRYRIGSNPGPIPVRQRFRVGNARLLYPLDPTDPTGFHPEEIINCKCLVVEIMPEVQDEVRSR